MNDILKEIYKIGIVPVIALEDVKDAGPLAQALTDGGLPCAEVTFRTAAAEESIKIMTAEFPEMLVGAGTVLTTEQVDRAVNAGAKFIVSPGLNPEVVKYCIDRNITVCPGCSNPSDIELAIALGLDVVKFFPAEAAGGLAMIKAMSAPYVNMKFMPTGGINANNLNEYLAFKKIIACGGSFMVKSDMIKAGQFDKITKLTKEAVDKMLGYEIKGEDILNMYGATIKTLNILVNNVDRAVYHLGKAGCAFNMDTAEYDSDGKLTAIDMEKKEDGLKARLVIK